MRRLVYLLILLGAAAGRTVAAADAPAPASSAAKWWSFQPVRTAISPPRTADVGWPRGDVDRFVLAKLESQAMKPPPDADKRTLIRRATFDLTGLPPTPADVDAFLADPSTDAFAKVVERLLASPQYGERWGRH